VSDMTLLSTISNEAINENLKKRFENKEIYVSPLKDCLLLVNCRVLRGRSDPSRAGGDGPGERLASDGELG
jgi:hypothetical protein